MGNKNNTANSTENLVYDGFHKIAVIDATIKGQKVVREKLIVKGAVGAYVTDARNHLGLVKQLRPTVGESLWEIPAGILDKPDLTSLETLLEELREECQISSEDLTNSRLCLKPIESYYMMAGSSDAKMEIFKVEVPQQKDQQILDANEEVEEVRWFSHEEIIKMKKQGVFKDSKTLIVVGLYLQETFNKRINKIHDNMQAPPESNEQANG